MRARRAAALAALAALALPVQPASAAVAAAPAPAASPGEAADCPAGAAGVRIRPATYVALGKGLLFRLQVERSVDGALLLVNQVDGNRLHDRRYWKPVKAVQRCGQHTVDYLEEDAPASAPGLRLVLEPAEEIRRPGLPQPMVVFAGNVVLPSGERQPLQFEEVVVKREIGADPRKK